MTELETGLGLPNGALCAAHRAHSGCRLWNQGMQYPWAHLQPGLVEGGAGSNEQELLSPGSEPHSGPISHTAENPVSSKERHAPPAPHPTSGPYCSQTTPEKSLFPFSRLLMQRIKRKPQSGFQSPQTQEIRPDISWGLTQTSLPHKASISAGKIHRYTEMGTEMFSAVLFIMGEGGEGGCMTPHQGMGSADRDSSILWATLLFRLPHPRFSLLPLHTAPPALC